MHAIFSILLVLVGNACSAKSPAVPLKFAEIESVRLHKAPLSSPEFPAPLKQLWGRYSDLEKQAPPPANEMQNWLKTRLDTVKAIAAIKKVDRETHNFIIAAALRDTRSKLQNADVSLDVRKLIVSEIAKHTLVRIEACIPAVKKTLSNKCKAWAAQERKWLGKAPISAGSKQKAKMLGPIKSGESCPEGYEKIDSEKFCIKFLD